MVIHLCNGHFLNTWSMWMAVVVQITRCWGIWQVEGVKCGSMLSVSSTLTTLDTGFQSKHLTWTSTASPPRGYSACPPHQPPQLPWPSHKAESYRGWKAHQDIPSTLPFLFIFLCIYLFNWSIVDLQCCANFCCTAKRLSYTHIYILFFCSFPLWFIPGYWI